MGNENQLFANGRLSVMSTKLFGADKFNRLADCSCLAEAVRILSEYGYGGGASLSDPNDYEQLLVAESDKAMQDFKELCFNKKAVRYFLARYDFVNAKTLMKAKYMRVDGTDRCFANATYFPAKMQEDFVADEYGAYPKEMAKACDQIDGEFADGNRSPMVVDTVLDKAMFAYLRRNASGSLLKKLFDWEADTTNLLALARCKKAGFDENVFSQTIVKGGRISEKSLLDLWNNRSDATDKFSDEYKRFVSLMKNDIVAAESLQSKVKRDILSRNADVLSVQPALDYFSAKVRETDIVRYILISVKNGVDKETIKKFFA